MRLNKRTKKLLFIVALVIVIVFFAVNFFTRLSKKHAQDLEIESLKNEYETVSEENSKIQETLNKGEDESHIEEIAREKYGYVNPEERIYYDSNGQ